MPWSCDPLTLTVGARPSKLSRAQVSEVLEELRRRHASVNFEPLWIKTVGDHDRTTPLWEL